MNILIENGICTFEDIKAKIEESTQLIESHQNSSNKVDSDDESPTMNYYGPMGEA